jgi:hypothetical protein
MRITLKRSGTFKCHWSNFDNRCGTDRQPIQEYRYECEIETDDNLDEHGFVVDQLDVNRTMQELMFPGPYEAVSCEKLTQIAVARMKILVMNHHAGEVYRVRVGVGVIPPKNVKGEAMIYAEWTL